VRWPWLVLLFASSIVPSIASAKSSNPAFLGVQMSDKGNRGVGPCVVSGVTKDSAAEAAGLQELDEFVSMDGRAIASCDTLITAIQAKTPGDNVKLVVTRDASQVTVRATLTVRDEILRKRFGGLPVPSTRLIRVDDRAEIDLAALKRQTTIVGWYPTTCDGCDQVFTQVAKWSRSDRQTKTPIKVAAATAGDLRMSRSVKDTLELLKHEGHKLDVPLLVADTDTFKEFALGDSDRVHFMVIDCHGIVQYSAFVVPTADDVDAVLDELYAATEQAARKK
jgi:membrane-associated protease RseP (regulator of RpoE activity)